jgi:hypothetical protein
MQPVSRIAINAIGIRDLTANPIGDNLNPGGIAFGHPIEAGGIAWAGPS